MKEKDQENQNPKAPRENQFENVNFLYGYIKFEWFFKYKQPKKIGGPDTNPSFKLYVFIEIIDSNNLFNINFYD